MANGGQIHEALKGLEGFSPEEERPFLRDLVTDIVRRWGYRRSEEPFEFASGGLFSHDFIDVKRAIADGERLRVAGKAVANVAVRANVSYESVGGVTMGADPITHATAIFADKKWFTVRKEPKGRGTNQLIEGAIPGPGTNALIVDDVTTTGNSLFKAVRAVQSTKAEVVMAIALVDRGPLTAERMGEEGIPYEPVITYRDLGIEPIE